SLRRKQRVKAGARPRAGVSCSIHLEELMEKRTFLKQSLAVAGAAAVSGVAGPLRAQEQVKLRISHFLSPMAPAQTMLFKPWADRVEKDSGGRIKCEIYPSMQLGGK